MADLTMRSILPVYLLTLIVFTLLPSDAAFAQGWRPAHYTPYHAPYYAPGYSYYAPAAYPPPMYAPYPPPRYPLTPPAAMAIPMPTQPLVEQPQAAIVPPEVKADAPIETPEPAKKMPGGAQRKEAFVDRLLPHIDAENKRLRLLRKRLIGVFAALDNGQDISDEQQRDLGVLAQRYRVDGDPAVEIDARTELLNRIDVIPASLTLAQAANESGWGKSRFATEANNLFGIWTYDKNKGLKPLQRDSDKEHLVRKFDSISESIKFYMLMLNSHSAYETLRELRLNARSNGDALSGLELAEGLEKYSAKGKTYIQLIQQLIEQNEWHELDSRQPAV